MGKIKSGLKYLSIAAVGSVALDKCTDGDLDGKGIVAPEFISQYYPGEGEKQIFEESQETTNKVGSVLSNEHQEQADEHPIDAQMFVEAKKGPNGKILWRFRRPNGHNNDQVLSHNESFSVNTGTQSQDTVTLKNSKSETNGNFEVFTLWAENIENGEKFNYSLAGTVNRDTILESLKTKSSVIVPLAVQGFKQTPNEQRVKRDERRSDIYLGPNNHNLAN